MTAATTSRQPQRWLWVAGPDYYLNDEGQDRPDLEPGAGFVAGGWWTCAPTTRTGDLALLYRSRVRKDISHLIVARTDAVPLDLPGHQFHGKPVCTYDVLAKFARPVTFDAIRNDSVLGDWAETRRRFVRSAVPVPDAQWQRLFELAGVDREALERQAVDGLVRIHLEKEIQQHILARPNLLAAHGLRRLSDGRKEVLLSDGGRADLLYTQRTGPIRRQVVIELKRGRIGVAAVNQVLRYRTLLDADRTHLRRTLGVLVGSDLDPRAAGLLSREGLRFVALADLGITRS
jgi:hypothetical protein